MRVRVTPLDPNLEVYEGEAPFPLEVGDDFVVEDDDGSQWITETVTEIGLGCFTTEDGTTYVIEDLEAVARPRA